MNLPVKTDQNTNPAAGCALCPRRCGADRTRHGGVCRMGDGLVIGRAAPHFGEEPCISGERGSGAVFFAGCPLGCAYCQNYALSRGREGDAVSEDRLAEIFRELEAQGVHNLNLVTGTQFVPAILRALEKAQPSVPVAWNTSGYETVETVRMLADKISIFMPDMKYRLPAAAAKYSRAPDYPAVAAAAIEEMVRITGPYELDGDGMLRRGVLIRHLVLPDELENTRRVIEWVSSSFVPGEVLFSLMAQYTPCGEIAAFPNLQRTITAEEWQTVLGWLDDSDIEDGFVQEPEAAGTDAIPDFDGTGV